MIDEIKLVATECKKLNSDRRLNLFLEVFGCWDSFAKTCFHICFKAFFADWKRRNLTLIKKWSFYHRQEIEFLFWHESVLLTFLGLFVQTGFRHKVWNWPVFIRTVLHKLELFTWDFDGRNQTINSTEVESMKIEGYRNQGYSFAILVFWESEAKTRKSMILIEKCTSSVKLQPNFWNSSVSSGEKWASKTGSFITVCAIRPSLNVRITER